MKFLAAAPSPLPELARLRPRQQMAMDCALCARRLGASGRRLGEVRHRGFLFQLWACAPQCQVAGSNQPDRLREAIGLPEHDFPV